MPGVFAKFCLAVAALFLLPAIAQAQGLGRLTVHSARGQPLHADVAIVSMQSDKEGGLHGSIATPDRYREMGVEFNALLFSIRVSVESRDGRPVLLLTSTRPIDEPFLDVLIVLHSAGGRLIRKYSVLFD